ncbi:hypothetical protein AWC38_SpisGene15252 [Stylophora pistillata]|uniref:Uncharacterized protein n=2 Tax=Stylophora pistillata TaxID=50429 RepID=A0A2B4RU42_STYPI|nr:hypothetical protein AWC38_SpisGene15252 [Stylophora pistillata]
MDDRIFPKEYNPRPERSETKQRETNEGRDLEYFHVPADNQGTTTADYLVDFKTNEFLRRVDRDGICYLGQLPDKLPKGSDLQTALREVFDARPSRENQDLVGDYWFVTDKVDKAHVKEQVQRFCNPGFPIYRVKKVELVSADAVDGDGRSNRKVRGTSFASVGLRSPPLCSKPVSIDCHPNNWLYDLKIRGRHCTWWLTCTQGRHSVDCGDTKWDGSYDSIICYQIRCP